MRNARKSLVLVSVMVASLLALSSAGPTQAQGAFTPALPFTIWDIPSVTALDGYGGWLATGNDPAPGPGQALPTYDYLHQVVFKGTSAQAFAEVSLEVIEGEKFASLFVSDLTESRTQTVRIRYPWVGLQYYFLYFVPLAPGIWGGYVYDNGAGVWTTIGLVVLPAGFTQLEPTSVTGVDWTGPDQESCAAFPLADVYRMKPFGVVGQTLVAATADSRHEVAGTCPATTMAEFPTPDFDRYLVGEASVGTPAAASATATPEGRTTEKRPFLGRADRP
jgi:hypothetical protein